ncbi:hypothetical protein [Rubellimicrobium mesophilum]|uniref:hypothetical protein n=1 Tax=Rubellimicrobium mesophilum TaxID=1123067 RepID=UPI000568E0E4|nr:hypothetical protein [Rubellimicrobium mesophilum]
MLRAKDTPFDLRLNRLSRVSQEEAKVVRVQVVDGVLVRFEEPPDTAGRTSLSDMSSARFIEAGLRHVSMLGLNGDADAVVITPQWPPQESPLSNPSLSLDVQVVERSAVAPERPGMGPSPLSPSSKDMKGDYPTEACLNALTALVGLGGLAALIAAFSLGDQEPGLSVFGGATGLILASVLLVAVELRRTIRGHTRGVVRPGRGHRGLAQRDQTRKPAILGHRNPATGHETWSC